jgi:VWFA-related protein
VRGLVYVLAVALGLLVPQAPDERAAVPALLDVLVSDARGREVSTLTAADFAVSEDGVPLTIRNARFVRVNGSEPPAAPDATAPTNPSGDARVVAIYLDEFHVTAGPAANRARDALVHFVRDSLGPSDFVVVLKPLDSVLTIHVSSDRAAAADLIAAFAPRRGDYTPRTAFERDFIAGAPARAAVARAQISITSLNALATYLGRLPQARKTLLLVSEGFATGTRRGEEFVPGFNAIAAAANRNHVAVYPIELPVETVYSSASADGSSVAQDTRVRERLHALAAETTGRVLPGEPLADGLESALRDAAGYYVLSVSRGSAQPTGRLHPVSVTTKRADLTVRARKGYWSPSEDEARPSAPLSTALAVPAPPIPRKVSTLIRPWFGITREADGNAHVSFVWEPAPRIPGERRSGPQPARVNLTVTTPNGVPLFDGVVLPSSGVPTSPTIDRQSQASFTTSAGRLLVQMAIEDVAARVVDRDVRDLIVVPPQGPVSIGTARVYRARTARDQSAFLADLDAPPVSARAFSRSEQLIVRLPVLSTSGDPTVSAQLSSGLGGAMRELALTPHATRSDLYQLTLPLAALPAGSYTLTFVAKAGERDARETLAFRVTP